MPTLTASASFTIGAGASTVESATVTILPALAGGTGRGRLVHPTLGTYDYEHQPDHWTNIDGDLIVPPIWASEKTLLGASNTLMTGHIRDVTVTEQWTAFATKIAHVRALLLFWQNPPDPDNGFVEWWPNYTSAQGFKVAMVGLEVGGEEVTLDWISRRHSFVTEGVILRMRIIDRVS
ncbi:hypothetical protein U5817_10040 [Aromatoleum evansii]|uniref:Uncharacterized protein n=1 Tax=Aromatoleum evansii TaxID=59406 RepID=A0ABZ1AR04_AROEV|nr:hypothetical protein U5817_09690 [Aromatoleum evansii]WRL48367.1 hypothetical protein U5817_10040 [Aromatoleum evansii]